MHSVCNLAKKDNAEQKNFKCIEHQNVEMLVPISWKLPEEYETKGD